MLMLVSVFRLPLKTMHSCTVYTAVDLQANTVPGSFWAVGFLLQPRHADILRQVQQELSSPAAGAHSTDQADTAPGGHTARRRACSRLSGGRQL